MKELIRYHQDAGHGWMAVTHRLAHLAGIRIQNVSTYSYIDDHCLYLEEDCDASLLLNNLNTKGIPFKVVHVDDGNSSPIRNKASITSDMQDRAPMTGPQRRALANILQRWHRDSDKPTTMTFCTFRRLAMKTYDDAVMIKPRFDNPIWLGIEPDGYTHS